MTEYKWLINQMDCVPIDGNLTDFVVNVYWTRAANKIVNKKEYFALINGIQSFSKNDIINFIPYENLTYEIVCAWLNASINVQNLDTNLDAQIQNEVNPPIITLPLPWVKDEILADTIQEKEVILEPKTI